MAPLIAFPSPVMAMPLPRKRLMAIPVTNVSLVWIVSPFGVPLSPLR
jgi:hypothetical protein